MGVLVTGDGGAVAVGGWTAALRSALAAEPDGCLVVGAPGEPLTAGLDPGRRVAVAAPGARVPVAAGLSLAGRRVVALTGADVPPRLPHGGMLVAVVREARVAGACWGAGWTVVQPAWPEDVATLLSAALAHPAPVVLLLAPEPGAVPASAPLPRTTAPPPGEPPDLGVPRLLRDGPSGLLAASGARRVRLLLDVARMLAGRGVSVRALELHTAAAGEGPGPVVTDRVLFVGERPEGAAAHPAAWPGGLRAVEVPDEPRGAMEAVGAYLRARP